mgnify:FL=1
MIGNRKKAALNWFLRELGGGAGQTVRALKLIGGQITTPVDYALDAMTTDLMKRARSFAYPARPFDNVDEVLNVSGMSRSGNVVTVTLANAPGQTIATGMTWSATVYPDQTFNADHAEITVLSQTSFTYANTGSNKTLVIATSNDIPAIVFCHVPLNTAGHPKADFVAVLSATYGPQPSNPDLNGVYVGTFPGGLPSNVQASQGAISSYTPGGSTFVLTLSGTDTSGANLTFTGVPTDDSFRLPTLIRAGDGAGFLRADYASVQSRYGVQRMMDSARINASASLIGWDKRSKVTYGLCMTLEDQISMCNQLGCDLWHVFPTTVTQAYVTAACELIDATLDPTLTVRLEWGNELWNFGFKQWHWMLAQMRAETQALLNGYDGLSQITSMSRTSNTVTFNLNRASPYTVGQHIAVQMTGNQDFNTTDVAVSASSGNSFSYVLAGADASFGTPGNGAVFGNLASTLFSGNPADKWEGYALSQRLVARCTYEMAQTALAVFGALGARCKIVLPWQCVDYNGEYSVVGRYMLPWLETMYGPVNAWLWSTGGAPYCYASGSDTTPAQAAASVMGALDDLKFNLHYASYLAHKYGLKHEQYEGGTDYSYLATVERVDAAFVSEDMRIAHEYILNQVIGFGVDLHVCYNTSFRWPGSGGSLSWGMAAGITDAGTIGNATAKRQQATDNVLLAARPPVTDPNQIPGNVAPLTGLATFWDNQFGTFSTNGMQQMFQSSSVLEQLVYVIADGNYAMTIYGKCQVGGGVNGVKVYLDDVLLGTHDLFADGSAISTGTSGGSASPTTFALTGLTEGKHRIKFVLKDFGAIPDGLGISRFTTVAS